MPPFYPAAKRGQTRSPATQRLIREAEVGPGWSARPQPAEAYNEAVDRLPEHVSATASSWPHVFPDGLKGAQDLYSGWNMHNDSPGFDYGDVNNALTTQMAMVLEAMSGVLRGAMQSLLYLGPLRSYPPRRAVPTRQNASEHTAGDSAWAKLASDAVVRNEVNAWLSDERYMKTPYRVAIHQLVALPDVESAR